MSAVGDLPCLVHGPSSLPCRGRHRDGETLPITSAYRSVIDTPARPSRALLEVNNAARPCRRDRVALATWPKDHTARIGLGVRLEWDRVRVVHPKVDAVAVIGFALAQALAKNPLANRRVAIWAVRSNPTVRLSFAVDSRDDLRFAVVDACRRIASCHPVPTRGCGPGQHSARAWASVCSASPARRSGPR